jgi:hypothetical protein
MSTKVSPAEVVTIVQHYDPLCNREPLPQPPATSADAAAMLDRQRLAKAAVMRGAGLSNTAELVTGIHALQKNLLELTAENHALDTKVSAPSTGARSPPTPDCGEFDELKRPIPLSR